MSHQCYPDAEVVYLDVGYGDGGTWAGRAWNQVQSRGTDPHRNRIYQLPRREIRENNRPEQYHPQHNYQWTPAQEENDHESRSAG